MFLLRLTEILSGEKHQLNYSPGGSTQNTLKTINVKDNYSEVSELINRSSSGY